ncbi:adenosylhomocysteine nucleosidase [Duganella sp. 3397]|uniref:adenosylhomocysteine nucleosidase n=1 Tax=Duganella phyllosphaerae TaxID=762836 RepID=A0A1E7WH16_9BURK|nr:MULTISPECIES: 5'-methylthioadenosine/adenosylhomocysteine nucleosidase [Duganella]MDR7047832.1 adenosylhomocysteine nucleosidase [Duganella sp. 3397]OEZ97643.1 5'-methylthioadenosine/S-adenosylhomocysteine nucleosidase [Duganella phyllosphaerae]
MRLGIISALAEEQQGLLEALESPVTRVHGMREYTAGTLWEIDAVCVLSRIGKVAAAMTAAILVEKFGVTHIVFTGVAGSGDAQVNVGDIVVADSLVQHDMDASPLFPRFEVPLTGLTRFATDVALTERLAAAAAKTTRVHRGLIASGDQFIGRLQQITALKTALPDLLAVEMEGAAVAQVCFELGIPFAVIRTISDNANDEAAVDFLHFIQTVASRYAHEVIENFCKN